MADKKITKSDNPKTLKFFDDIRKFNELKFDYEVSKMIIENDENLISKMYYYDKETQKNSIKLIN